jgi:hypothetical protein
MALPVTIGTGSTDVLPLWGAHGGPFISSTGNVDAFTTLDAIAASEVKAWKATDPTDSFSEIDGSNRPLIAGDLIDAMYCYQVDDTIHIATQELDGLTHFHLFDMHDGASGDAWQAAGVEELIEDVVKATGGTQPSHYVGVSVRSDGDTIVVYDGLTDKEMGGNISRCDLARRESGSWTAGIGISGVTAADNSEEYEMGPGIQIGDHDANDRMHSFYRHGVADDLLYSTYLSDNTWGHQATSVTTSAAAGINTRGVGPSAAFDDGGTNKVRIAFSPTSYLSATVMFDDADVPSSPTTTEFGDNSMVFNNPYRPFLVVVDGTTQHFLYGGSASGGYLYRAETGAGDDTWAADVQEFAELIHFLSANVYTRDSTKVIGLLYKNSAGTVKYNEIDISVAVVDLPQLMRQHANTLLRM